MSASQRVPSPPPPRCRHGTIALGFAALLMCACRKIDQTGQLVVWTDTRGGGALTVRVDSQIIGELRQFSAVAATACTPAAGVVTVRLPAGSHAVVASDRAGRAWRGTVTVRSRQCERLRLAPIGATRDGVTIPADSADESDKRPM